MISLTISLSFSDYLPTYLAIYLPMYLSIYLSIYLPIFLSIYLTIYLSIYLSLSLSLCLSVCLSICLCARFKTKLFCETSSFFELNNIKNRVRAPLRGRVFQHMDIFLFNYVPRFRHNESGFSQISIFCGCVKSHGRVWKNESHGVILMVFVGRKPSAWKRQLYAFSSALPTSLFHQRVINA